MTETLLVVCNHWREAMAICLKNKREDSEYEGPRVTPEKTARSAFQSQSISSDHPLESVVEEIHSAARTEWIYRDRENRG